MLGMVMTQILRGIEAFGDHRLEFKNRYKQITSLEICIQVVVYRSDMPTLSNPMF
jgi:hypothetical protein